MRRLGLLLPVLALASAALSGCGGDEASAVERIRTAPEATAEAETAAVEMTMSGPGYELSSEGTIALEEQQGELTMAFGGDLTIDLVMDGLVSYQRSPLFGELPDGVEWVRVDTAELNEAQTGVHLEELSSTSNNPTELLASLEGVSEDGVEEVGPDEVRGVEATHYRAGIDLLAAAEDSGDVTDPEQFERFAEIYGDEPIQVDVWLDDEGRVVRQDMSFELGGQGIETRIEFFDFGTEVDVDVPDEGEWIDLVELLPGS